MRKAMLLLLGLLTANCTFGQSTEVNRLDSLFTSLYNKNSFNGNVLIAEKGKVIFEKSYGFADEANKIKLNAQTKFELASVSKQFTAMAIVLLHKQGKLSYDDAIAKYIPELSFYGPITVRNLVNHTSGLADYMELFDQKWDKSKFVTNQDIVNEFVKYKPELVFKPNEKFEYSNTGYALLGLIIEKVSKKTYPQVLQELIFDPLGMKNTFVFDDLTKQDSVSQSYKNNYLRLAFEYLDQVYGDKNIYSTPRDLLQFDLALYSDKFLSAAMKAEMFKGYSYERKGTRNYGLGIRMLEFETGQQYFFHNGWWHGNTSAYVTLQKDSVTIIAISNKFTRKPYQTKRLAPKFGDYPFKFNDEEGE